MTGGLDRDHKIVGRPVGRFAFPSSPRNRSGWR